jgi:hypothetical protein
MYLHTWTLAFFFAAGQLLSFVAAHVEMKFPTPFRSKFLVPQGPNTDFTNTAPLSPDGSNFPCKGYHHDSLPPTATLTAGQSFTLQYFLDTFVANRQIRWIGHAQRRQLSSLRLV